MNVQINCLTNESERFPEVSVQYSVCPKFKAEFVLTMYGDYV